MQYEKSTDCEIAQYRRRKEEIRLPVIKIENLEAEMKRNKISRSNIAHTLGLSYRTIHSRFNGESEWTYSECVKVRDTYFPDMDLTYLFQKEPEEKGE